MYVVVRFPVLSSLFCHNNESFFFPPVFFPSGDKVFGLDHKGACLSHTEQKFLTSLLFTFLLAKNIKAVKAFLMVKFWETPFKAVLGSVLSGHCCAQLRDVPGFKILLHFYGLKSCLCIWSYTKMDEVLLKNLIRHTDVTENLPDILFYRSDLLFTGHCGNRVSAGILLRSIFPHK